jgi:hypothetical protein
MSTAVTEGQDIELDGLMSAASLLFNAGMRPDRAAVRGLAARDREFAVSLEPELAPGPDPGGRGDWVELVIHGLTFDLAGLAPREPIPLPEAGHLFGLAPEIVGAPLEAVTLVPGPHLAGGRQLLPVLRSHAVLAAYLAALPGVAAVAWHAARAWSAPEFFRGNVLRWIAGGAFPALGLAALNATADGGIASEGLSLFTGQELELNARLAEDRAQGARIALRLMHWLVENGPLDRVEALTGPGGELLQLEPSPDRRLIKVWKT